jgi:peptide/nickel transport system substrate-binding protein
VSGAADRSVRRFGRRTVLAGAATAGAAAMLAACSRQAVPARQGASASSSPGPSPSDRGRTSRPSPSATPGVGKGDATTPLAKPAKLREAPALAAQVAAKSLPPLAERLPDQPYVLPHRWLEPGNYGGRMTVIVPSTSDASIAEWFYGMSPLRLLFDARDVGPGYFDKWS